MIDSNFTRNLSCLFTGNYGNNIDGANISHRCRRSTEDEDSDTDSLEETDDEQSHLLKDSPVGDPSIRAVTPSAKPITHDKYALVRFKTKSNSYH